MQPSPYVAVGRVIRAHGLKGELSVAPIDRFEPVISPGLVVHFAPPGTRLRFARITAVRNGPKGPLIRFEGVDDIDTASSVRGATLMAACADLPAELIAEPFDPTGITILDTDGIELGHVAEVIHTGANDVWVVVDDEGRDVVLLPVIDDVVRSVDESARTATVHLLPGLMGDR